jgi:REP element-mobilizing transposase RayT
MARRQRVAPIGVPQHVIQRGNNRHACFSSTSDMKAYINWLRDYANEYEVEIHAWVKGDTSEYWWSYISGFVPLRWKHGC